MSSLLFGTSAPGRALVLYVLLPVGGGFLLPFATPLIIGELAELGRFLHLLPREPEELRHHHHHHLALPSPVWVAVFSVLLFGLIHSGAVRAAALQIVRAVGFVLATIFVHAPRWVLSRPLVQRIMGSGPVLAFRRFVLRPAIVAGAAFYPSPLRRSPPAIGLSVAGVLFVGGQRGAQHTPGDPRGGDRPRQLWGALLLAGSSSACSLGLLQLIVRACSAGSPTPLDRVIYTVDEWLRFRKGQHPAALALKAVAGLVWFAIAYFLRILVNLFVEPTFNPIGRFPPR